MIDINSYIPFYKDITEYEIALMLFKSCNLRCKFCFESDKYNDVDIDYIGKVPDIVIDKFRHDYSKYNNIKLVKFMIWGGEVFYDQLNDNIFNSYFKLIDELTYKFKLNYPKVNIEFSWLSNGVFNKVDRVESILNYSNGFINFSYDPVGRFNSIKSLDLMKYNSKYFKDKGYGKNISITLTKESVDYYINGKSCLDYFCDLNYNIDTNYYIPNKGWESYLLDDNDLYKFYKWSLDNKLFNINVVGNFISDIITNSTKHYCNCKECAQLDNMGNWSVDCVECSSNLSKYDFYGDYTDIMNEDNTNDIKASIGIIKRGCTLCEYYNICQKYCWITMIFNKYNLKECAYKRTINYIKSNDYLIDEFNKWRSSND